MDSLDNLEKNYKSLVDERIKNEIKLYKLMYPNDCYCSPDIVISNNIHQDAINTYKEFNYPIKYIEELEPTINWNTIAGLTIAKQNIKDSFRILINALSWNDDTILHELTHTSDYYSYSKRHKLLELTYCDLLELDDFMCVYLFSEFRAFYRGAMFSNEDLYKRIKFETARFEKRQQKTISHQNLEAYYYHFVSYIGFYCAFLDKCAPNTIPQIMNNEDVNTIHGLTSFLYPLRNKDFVELELYFSYFHTFLDRLISN